MCAHDKNLNVRLFIKTYTFLTTNCLSIIKPSIGKTIRGNIAITCKENENFNSLNKEQVIKYLKFLKNASFNYNDTIKPKRISNKMPFIERNYYDNIEVDTNSNINDDILKMILGIQAIILKFIQNNNKK